MSMSGDLLEAGQLVHQDLLPDVLEVDVDLPAVALALEAQDRALAELRVPDAGAEPHRQVLAGYRQCARAPAGRLAGRRREVDSIGGVQRTAHRDSRAD